MALQTNPDGSLLIQNGALVESIECCCEGCIPNSLPTICQVKLTAESDRVGLDVISSSEWNWWAKFGPGPVSTRPVWQQSTVSGVTWYTYAVDLAQPCCSYRCEDEIAIPLPGAEKKVECLGPVIDVDCGDGITFVPVKLKYTLQGDVRFAIREMISDTILQLAFRYNCSTAQLQRRVTRLSFLGTEVIAGRYAVKEKLQYVAQIAYDPEECRTVNTSIVEYCRNRTCNDPYTLETYYCASGTEPNEVSACDVMPVMPDVDFDTITSEVHYCWFHFTPSEGYFWETMPKVAVARNYLTHAGDWEDCDAMDDPWYFPVVFNTPPEEPEVVQCPGSKDVVYQSTNYKSLDFDPPATWTALSCDNTATIPIDELGTTIPGLTINNHDVDDVWGTVRVTLDLNTAEGGGVCPENGSDSCQEQDVSDDWPGT